jgi:hypothetical protein
MIFNKDVIELNDEIVRSKEMDFYRFHSFINSIQEAFELYKKLENEEARLAVLGFAKEIIRRFTEIYGKNSLPYGVRKKSTGNYNCQGMEF